LEDQRKKRRNMAKRSRTYYCKTCQKPVTFQSNEVMKCNKCSSLFGNSKRNPFEINMRTTWSGQTKVEFSQQTIDESINEMNSR
jgi:ribosomal protein L37AE/L43A